MRTAEISRRGAGSRRRDLLQSRLLCIHFAAACDISSQFARRVPDKHRNVVNNKVGDIAPHSRAESSRGIESPSPTGPVMTQPNLFSPLPDARTAEVFEALLTRPGLKIERIVTHGQASPGGFWYDQAQHEWVVLLSGSASLQFEGEEPRTLQPGDWIDIPPHRRHRVAWTDLHQPTVWLAVHAE